MDLDEGCDLIKPKKDCISVLNDLYNLDVLDMQKIGIEYEDVRKAIVEFKTMKARIAELEAPKKCGTCVHWKTEFWGDKNWCNKNVSDNPMFKTSRNFYCKWYDAKDK